MAKIKPTRKGLARGPMARTLLVDGALKREVGASAWARKMVFVVTPGRAAIGMTIEDAGGRAGPRFRIATMRWA